MTVIQIHHTRAAKLRAVAAAAFHIGEYITDDEVLAAKISAMAVKRFSQRQCSPAMALSLARREAHARKENGTGTTNGH